MLLKRINLESELRRLKNSSPNSNPIIEEFYTVLENSTTQKEEIVTAIKGKAEVHQNNFVFDYLDTANVYHVNQIKDLCVDYRLRFLDASYFKGEIPLEATLKVEKLEKLHNIKIKNFKIIAPSKLFRLEDKDDPLLFAPLGNNYYYLIHKWGTDISPFRKLKMWPFKSVINLLLLILGTTFFTTFLISKGIFTTEPSTAKILIIGFFIFKSLAAIVLYLGIANAKNFSPFVWNSKYYN